MAESRFDKYVRDTLADATKERRDELVAAVESAQAELSKKVEALREIADAACAEADGKIRALARKWGWKTVPGSEKEGIVETYSLEGNLAKVFRELRSKYGCYDGTYQHRRTDGTMAAAQRALGEFDAAVEKAARRLVVVKKDLGMKAEAFDRAMADAVAKLLKSQVKEKTK